MDVVFLRVDLDSLQEYNLLARALPETTPVYLQTQDREPQGYDMATFGDWPGPCLLLQMEVASSHRSPSVRYFILILQIYNRILKSRSSAHKVMLLWSLRPIEVSPLMLTGPLKQIVSYM